jgi:hypothetical protein
MGDFQEPYGAIFGECDKLGFYAPLLFLVRNLSFLCSVKLLKSFSYTVAKALQDVCNLPFPSGG